jgi:hypothetical protein
MPFPGGTKSIQEEPKSSIAMIILRNSNRYRSTRILNSIEVPQGTENPCASRSEFPREIPRKRKILPIRRDFRDGNLAVPL